MHNIKQSCKLIKFLPLDVLPQREAGFLEETFDVVVINYTDDGKEEYVGYAPLDFDTKKFHRQIKQNGYNLPQFQEEILESKNWLKENVIKFAPFEIGSFLVYGIHEPHCPKTKKIPLQIYAATAFGSEHQTTKMCLTAISELHQKNISINNILDMGSGSGILSIAAIKIWNNHPKVIAADIDPESVDVTTNNAVTNDVNKNLMAILSDGYKNPLIKQNAPYNLIFANILANPLKTMAKRAYQSLKKDGCYLISGFIDNQEQDIIKYHQDLGFNLLKTYKMDNWRAALLQK